MEQIELISGSTRFSISVDMQYSPYRELIRTFVYKRLTDYTWIPRIKRYKPDRRYLYYSDRNKKLYMPIELYEELRTELELEGIEYTQKQESLIIPRKMTTKMLSDFSPREHQVEIINYLKSEGLCRKGLATFTGSGKTVSSIAGMIGLGYAGMIIVSGLTQQWLRSITQFTDIKQDKLYLVQGFDSLDNLLNSNLQPDIIVFSLETLRLYISRIPGSNYELMKIPYEKFLQVYGIGTKIIDEVHLNFYTGTIIDMHSNIPNNIYLTATFNNTDRITKKIFDTIYPVKMRFGADKRNIYIDVYQYTFIGDVKERLCMTERGYMHAKYENQLLKVRSKLVTYVENILIPILNGHWVNKKKQGEKVLIYFSKIETVQEVYKLLKSYYNDKNFKIVKYILHEQDSILNDADIILTSPKKAGVGTDIKNLRVVINTVSIQSEVSVAQMKGRLRELPDGTTPEYIELIDVGIQSQQRHATLREQIHICGSKNLIKQTIP